MEQENYGFVYIWYDRKHKRYYIGCHWGHEDDGYICSSSWMLQAYKRRPQDFKRKILSRIYTNRSDLLEKEFEWFQLIKPEEIKHRYYNLNIRKNGHWSATDNAKSISEKLSIAHNRPETKAKSRAAKLGDKNPMKNPEVAAKAGKSKIGMKAWNKGLSKETNETIKQQGIEHSKKMKGRPAWNKGYPLSEEQKKNISEKWKGTKCFYNPITMHRIRIKSDEIAPDGYIPGRGNVDTRPKK